MPPVIVAIMWRLMLHPRSGPVNEGARELGFAGDTNWLGDFRTALPAVIVVGVWAGMPQTTITLLAGLQSVPEELHEAAAIDGAAACAASATSRAGAPTGHRRDHDAGPDLQLQLLRPGLRAHRGRTRRRTMLPMLFAYNEAFRYGHWGYAAAMGNVMVVVVGVFLIIYLRANARERG